MTSKKNDQKWISEAIEKLDPEKDSHTIIRLFLSQNIPRSPMVVNLIYTIGLTKLCAAQEQILPVHRNGTGKVYKKADQRADDTNYYLFRWLDSDLSDPEVQQSLSHVRRIHDRIAVNWPIRNDTFIYALSSFALLVEHFSTHIAHISLTTDKVNRAFFYQFRGIGEALGIHSIPESLEAMSDFMSEYEHSVYFGYSSEGEAVTDALIDQFTNRWFSPLMRLPARYVVLSLIEDHISTELTRTRPSPGFKFLVRTSLRTLLWFRARFLPDPHDTFRIYKLTQKEGG